MLKFSASWLIQSYFSFCGHFDTIGKKKKKKHGGRVKDFSPVLLLEVELVSVHPEGN